ncbi:hypothetical protein KJ765_00060 [Candidatus Micrarchaeota archaeon]|nr:hypothetical protein [Candidatus Micrarchaeota archaeon]
MKAGVLPIIALFLMGCLSGLIESGASPSAVLNATDAATVVAETPTPQVTVTERIVYVTVTPTPKPLTPTPEPKPKGGVHLVSEVFEYTPGEMRDANADRSNPFEMGTETGDYLKGLEAGEMNRKGVPFTFLPPYGEAGNWNVLTTTDRNFYSGLILMKNQLFSKVYFVMSASYGKRGGIKLATLSLHYGDATSQDVELIAGENVWNLNEKVPEAFLFWNDPEANETLSVIELNVSQPLEKLVSVGLRKQVENDDGVAIFAVVGERALESKQILLTPEEFSSRQYDRRQTGVDSKGVHLTHREQGADTVYLESGTFTTPIYDLETGHVNVTNIDWDEETPATTRIYAEARYGSKEEIDRDWTAWKVVEKGKPLTPTERYIQLRFNLATGDERWTPVVKQIRMDYTNPV